MLMMLECFRDVRGSGTASGVDQGVDTDTDLLDKTGGLRKSL